VTTPTRQGRQAGPRAYGADFAGCFGMPEPPTHVNRTLRRGLLAVSELKFDTPIEQTESLGYDDAFLVSVWLKSHVDHEVWLNGRPVPVDIYTAGSTYSFDLRLDPRALVREASHVLHFYMPLSALNASAEQNGSAAISDLVHRPGVGSDDPVMRHLAQAALHAFRRPHETTGLLLDEILGAACAHMVGRSGTSHNISRFGRGLAQSQVRRAKEMMDEHLDLSLSDLAKEFDLSVRHFARSFRQSTGVSPHQWMLARRIAKAKSLLATSNLSLAEIAAICGFSSQSHLNAVFRRESDISPGRWRRLITPPDNTSGR
jgi:AraC family transcriptional regulator